MAVQYVNEAEAEYLSRNHFLDELTEWYLTNAASSSDAASLHREYIAKRLEAVEMSKQRVQSIGRVHDSVVGPGRRPALDPYVTAVPQEALPWNPPNPQLPGAPNSYWQTPAAPLTGIPLGYQLVPVRSRISGQRVASGVMALVLSLLATLTFTAAITSYRYTPGFSVIPLFLAMWGCFVCGIVIMAKSRSRGRGAPVTLIIFTAVGLLGFLLQTYGIGGIGQFLGIPLSISILILIYLDMRKTD